MCVVYCFQAEDGIRDLVRSRGLGDVYKRQAKFKDERFAEPNEAQHYPLPALKAGEAVFLRFTSSLPVNPAAAMNCAEAS